MNLTRMLAESILVPKVLSQLGTCVCVKLLRKVESRKGRPCHHLGAASSEARCLCNLSVFDPLNRRDNNWTLGVRFA